MEFKDLVRRSEGGGFIRWHVNGETIVEVTTKMYYQGKHHHDPHCSCPALIHSYAFAERLRLAFAQAEKRQQENPP